jgi:hypothetical protein
MSNSVDDFIGSFNDFARTNKFQVSVNRLDGNKLKFHCEAAQMPGRTIEKIPVNYRGRVIPIPGDTVFNDWTVTVKLDDTYQLRKELKEWHNSINSARGNTGDSSLRGVSVDAQCEALDTNGGVIETFKFSYMWPTVIGDIEYSMADTNQIAMCQVTFAYTLHD